MLTQYSRELSKKAKNMYFHSQGPTAQGDAAYTHTKDLL